MASKWAKIGPFWVFLYHFWVDPGSVGGAPLGACGVCMYIVYSKWSGVTELLETEFPLSNKQVKTSENEGEEQICLSANARVNVMAHSSRVCQSLQHFFVIVMIIH